VLTAVGGAFCCKSALEAGPALDEMADKDLMA
jgi:hypothetical protein